MPGWGMATPPIRAFPQRRPARSTPCKPKGSVLPRFIGPGGRARRAKKCIGLRVGGAKRVAASKGRIAAEKEAGPIPVSYTHLDVYKRQPSDRASPASPCAGARPKRVFSTAPRLPSSPVFPCLCPPSPVFPPAHRPSTGLSFVGRRGKARRHGSAPPVFGHDQGLCRQSHASKSAPPRCV